MEKHKQKLHIINEKEIMTEMGRHPFLCTLCAAPPSLPAERKSISTVSTRILG